MSNMETNMNNYDDTGNFDDNFNIDLPGEIEDLHDENCEWEAFEKALNSDDFLNAHIPENSDEFENSDDFLAPDDDSEPNICWNDADSFTSIGWGEDEEYDHQGYTELLDW
jgi:hypothetical protein